MVDKSYGTYEPGFEFRYFPDQVPVWVLVVLFLSTLAEDTANATVKEYGRMHEPCNNASPSESSNRDG